MKYTILVSKGPFKDIQTAACAEDSINWWDDGQMPEQTACTIAWAATDFARYLPWETALKDSQEGWKDQAGTVILLGTVKDPAVAEFCREFGIQLDPQMPPETLRIIGLQKDGKQYVLLTGADRVGVMYGAFAYLERLGIHFLEPGEPSYTQACTEAEFDFTESPSYTTRCTQSEFGIGDEPYFQWMAHNRFNVSTFMGGSDNYRKKLGISRSVGGHEIFDYIDGKKPYPYCHKLYGGEGPEDPYPVSPGCKAPSGKNGELTYGDAHPEWYALADGVRHKEVMRDPALGWHTVYNICTSNEDAITEICRRAVDDLAEGKWKFADYLNVWPLDGGQWCQCEECEKQGNFTTRILLVAYAIDKAIKEAYRTGKIKRRVQLVCPAYHETLPVPDKELPADYDYSNITVVFYVIERCYAHDFDDPICVETNRLLYQRLSAWCDRENYIGDLMIGEYYNVSSFAAMPFVLTSRILNDIPLYYRMGARHFQYMHMPARDWGFIAINNYIHGKLIWNADADKEALLSTYFTARYGKLDRQMRALYAQLEKITANCKYFKHYQFMNGKIASLKNTLINAEDLSALTEKDLFPTIHMQFRGRVEDPQAGPSMEETLQGLEQALTQLLALESAVEESKRNDYVRDVRRLTYGCKVTRFTYLLCLCILKQADTRQEQELHSLAQLLGKDTESVMGFDLKIKTALDGTWLKDVYTKFFRLEKDQNAASGGRLI